jgi:hypothetical protein
LIVVAGGLARKAGYGGHSWVLLQYLLGFRRLGMEVLFLDFLEEPDPSAVRYLLQVMEAFQLDFALLDGVGGAHAGLPVTEVRARLAGSALLLNVMGYLRNQELVDAAPRRAFLDIDPGFGQMWQALGLTSFLDGHHVHITIGQNIGRADCVVPTGGLIWLTIPPPVVLEHWPATHHRGGAFTSVGSWRGAYGPVSYRGTSYGLRVHEFRRFAELPKRTGLPFEMALDIDPADRRDLDLLAVGGWALAAPGQAAGDPWSYQRYIQGSLAEFGVAKGMYVRAQSGWFSDRSACYLASGKPVLVQDTGLEGVYPTGEGLLVFRDPEGAAAGAAEIVEDYARHAKAARLVAESCFDSDLVLSGLLQRVGVS